MTQQLRFLLRPDFRSFSVSMLMEEGKVVLAERFYLLKGRLRVKNSDSGDTENVLHLDWSLAQGYPMDTLSVWIGAHAVSMECLSLDIPIAAYAGTFGNPWGPPHCYTVSDSTGSTDGQNLKAKKANSSPLSGILMQGFQVSTENGWPIISPTGLVYSLRQA